jgi:hypothetical protein
MTGIYGLDSSGPELALVGQVMALQALWDTEGFLTDSTTNNLSRRALSYFCLNTRETSTSIHCSDLAFISTMREQHFEQLVLRMAQPLSYLRHESLQETSLLIFIFSWTYPGWSCASEFCWMIKLSAVSRKLRIWWKMKENFLVGCVSSMNNGESSVWTRKLWASHNGSAWELQR